MQPKPDSSEPQMAIVLFNSPLDNNGGCWHRGTCGTKSSFLHTRALWFVLLLSFFLAVRQFHCYVFIFVFGVLC